MLLIREVMDSIFGAENMAVFPSIYPFLRIGLASHLHHYNEINKLIPPNGKLRETPLFTNSRVLELEKHVQICMPWDGHAHYFAEESVLMPHHVMKNNEKRIEQKIDELPSKIEALLEDKQMNGPVSLSWMKKLAENSPAMRRVEQTIACMESILEMRMESNSGLPADNA